MTETAGSLCFDEYGRPFIVLKEEAKQARVTGMDALKSHILAARSVADKLRTSLGPKGMDKMMVNGDGAVVVTNDGATILDLMDPEHEVAKLMVSLAQAQDREVGDGTTGVIVLAGALLQEAVSLLDKGVHPSRIADGYQLAAKAAAAHLDLIAFKVSVSADDTTWLLRAAKTALGSKIASKCLDHLADITVTALKTTCDLFQPDPVLNVNSIVMRGKQGGQIEDSELIEGVIVEGKSEISETLEDLRVAVFSGSALQLPNVHTKHQLDVKDLESYKELKTFVEDWWCDQVLDVVQKAGAQLVLFSGKIDENVNNLFLRNGIHSVENVREIEMAASLVKAHVISKAEELEGKKLGRVDKVRVLESGKENDKLIALEQHKPRIATILVRGSNNVVVEEVKRSIQDAICVVRNLVKDSSVVCGGGAAEISCSIALHQQSLSFPDLDQLIFQAFADALDVIPLSLAENAGMYPLQALTELKASHRPTLGVDCMATGDNDMVSQGVVEGLHAKKHQLVMASQLVSMVLKIDDVRGPKDQIYK